MTRFGYHQKCRFATSSIDGFPALRMKDFMAKERNRKKTQSQQRTLTPSSANEKLDPGSRRPTSNRLFLWFIFVGSLVGSMAVMTYLRLPPATAPVYTYQVLRSIKHDSAAFTQGLLIDNDRLYESTGRTGQSSLRTLDLATGKVITRKDLPDHYFAEGITLYGSKLYQLTFQNNRIRVYDKDSLELLEERDFEFEGWGLTSDADYLIHSDGSATIRYLDPETLEVVSKVTVHDGSQKIRHINELEYFDGRIYANVWHEDFILQIIPASGRVSARYDMTGLLQPRSEDREACLNGIAVDRESGSFYLTGKLWPKIFEVKFVEKKPSDATQPTSKD